MTTDTLHRAATHLRELAESVREDSWDGCCASPVHGAYVVAMRPAVALDLADLLTAVDRAERMAGVAAEHPEALSIRAKAHAVARTFLGESA